MYCRGRQQQQLQNSMTSVEQRDPCMQGGGRGAAQKRQSGAARTAEHLVAAREDAEFKQKASLEVTDVPNTIPAFKCDPALLMPCRSTGSAARAAPHGRSMCA